MSDANDQTVVVDRVDGVVTVTLNRPAKKNAITGEMWVQLREVFAEVGSSGEDRVLVITGAGGAFCSGADLGAVGDLTAAPLRRMRTVGEAALALHELPQPTIAKVGGVAAGAGANLALGCDLIVASETSRFSQIFSARGLSPDFGGTWLLPRLIGLHRAKELALFADVLSADQFAAIGLVNKVVPDDLLDKTVDEWARRLAAGPPLALSMTKKMLNASFSRTMSEALEDEGRSQVVNFGTKDTAEAMLAFMEKRPPVFKGH